MTASEYAARLREDMKAVEIRAREEGRNWGEGEISYAYLSGALQSLLSTAAEDLERGYITPDRKQVSR